MMGPAQRARRDARITWLRDHAGAAPGAHGNITDDQRAELESLRRTMIRRDLYGVGEQPKVQRWGIRLLLSAMRGDPLLNAASRSARRYRS